MTQTRRIVYVSFLFSLLALLVAACGGQETQTTPIATSQPVATMPPARFTAVAQQSAAKNTSVAPNVESLTTPTADVNVDRGERIYSNKKCGDCHGAQGEGVADKGKALVGTTLSYEEFDTTLRTGGQGALGPDHLYGPSAVSPSGMVALYAFVTSLGK